METKTIGKFISTLRKANGYTQAQLAEMLGVSNKTISNWENEISYPDLSLIPVIADLFGVTSDELLRGEKNTNKKVTIKDNNNTQPLTNNLINTTGKPLSKHQTVLSQPKVFGNRISSSTTQTINNNYKKTSTKKQQGTPKTNIGSFINNAMTNPGIKRTTRLKQSSIVSSITGSVNYNHKSSIQSTDFSKTPFAGELKCSGTKVPDEEVLIVHVHNHTESNVTNKNHSKQTSPYLKKNKTKQIYNTAKGNTNSGGSSNTKSISNGLFVDNNNNNNNYVTKTRTTEEDDNSPTKVNNNALPTAQTFTEITQDNNNNNNVMLTNNNNVTTPKTSRVVSKEHNSFTNLVLSSSFSKVNLISLFETLKVFFPQSSANAVIFVKFSLSDSLSPQL